MEINNKIYYLEYSISDVVHISRFGIKNKYRGRGYSKRIFNNLQRKYNRPICLECFPTLFNFYQKLGFSKDGEDVNGYFEMVRYRCT